MFSREDAQKGAANAAPARRSSPTVRRALTTALQVVLAFVLLVYLIVNTVVDSSRTSMFYTTFSRELIPSLPVPAFTLCSDEVDYNFQCTLYGTVAGNASTTANSSNICGGLIKFVDVSDNAALSGIVTKCYRFGTKDPLMSSSPPVPSKNWTAFHSPLIIQYSLVNASTLTKMSFAVWNPFQTPSGSNFSGPAKLTADDVFDSYQQTLMDACRERVFTFYWSKHVFVNGSEQWNVNWRSEFGVSSNAVGTNVSATGIVHFRPGTFMIPVTRDFALYPSVLPFATTFLVLLAALYTCCWLPLAGRGKYRPWGWIHTVTRYRPHKYIRPAKPTLQPTVIDILDVYLYESEKCEIN